MMSNSRSPLPQCINPPERYFVTFVLRLIIILIQFIIVYTGSSMEHLLSTFTYSAKLIYLFTLSDMEEHCTHVTGLEGSS
jgi:hypothetical protein